MKHRGHGFVDRSWSCSPPDYAGSMTVIE